ncbi:MAG: glycosyltransferase [Cyclobacteriaceae bacterium]
MNKRKVLYISYDGMTDPLGQSQVIPYLQGIAREGYQITILSCEKKAGLKKRKSLIASLLSQSNIAWETVNYSKRPPVFSTIFDVFRLKRKALKIFKKEQIEVVHCRSYLPALIGLILKTRFGAKFVFDMRGFWADERVDGNLWNLKNPIFSSIYKYFKKKEREFLENADSIISLTTNGKCEIQTWKDDYKKLPIVVIPCCADTDLFERRNVNTSAQKKAKDLLDISDDDFILTYLGSIGTWYMLEEMLDFFEELSREVKNAKFLFVSPSDSHRVIQEGFQKRQLGSETFIITESSRSDVPLYLSLSNYSIFFIMPSYSKKSSSPTKQGEIMAMGIPVICNSGVGDTSAIVEKYDSGFLIEKFTREHYNTLIEQMQKKDWNPDDLRDGAIDYFALDKGVEKYIQIYNSL